MKPTLLAFVLCMIITAGSSSTAAAQAFDSVVRYGGIPNHTSLAPAASSHSVVSPLTFNFTTVGNLQAMQSGTPSEMMLAQSVVDGFNEAADLWRARFVDPIDINIDIDFGPIGNGVLGGASSAGVGASYSGVADALALDQTTANDATAVANLQTSPMEFITNDSSDAVSAPRIRDDDGSANNFALDVNRANLKAIGGIPGNDPATDAEITFTDFTDFEAPQPTNLDWDFDRSDGISANTIDFVGVAAHEIGHAMGFSSGVDTVDLTSEPNGPQAPIDLNDFAVFSVLDLFRYSDNSLAEPMQPAGGLNDLAFGQLGGDTPFFSIDGGATELATFSTGAFNGVGGDDQGAGDQASHWQDNLGIGLMDPTFGTAVLGQISDLDYLALDVIGYDFVIPEPGSLSLTLLGMMCGMGYIRRYGRANR